MARIIENRIRRYSLQYHRLGYRTDDDLSQPKGLVEVSCGSGAGIFSAVYRHTPEPSQVKWFPLCPSVNSVVNQP